MCFKNVFVCTVYAKALECTKKRCMEILRFFYFTKILIKYACKFLIFKTPIAVQACAFVVVFLISAYNLKHDSQKATRTNKPRILSILINFGIKLKNHSVKEKKHEIRFAVLKIKILLVLVNWSWRPWSRQSSYLFCGGGQYCLCNVLILDLVCHFKTWQRLF